MENLVIKLKTLRVRYVVQKAFLVSLDSFVENQLHKNKQHNKQFWEKYEGDK